jgi:hypothetical protein
MTLVIIVCVRDFHDWFPDGDSVDSGEPSDVCVDGGEGWLRAFKPFLISWIKNACGEMPIEFAPAVISGFHSLGMRRGQGGSCFETIASITNSVLLPAQVLLRN